MAHDLTAKERSALSCFGPQTYSVFLDRKVADSLERKGLVTWVPPMFGGISWRLTEAGEVYRQPPEPSTDDEREPATSAWVESIRELVRGEA